MTEINNTVYFSGRIVSKFTFSHEIQGEKFFSSSICVKRYSGSEDTIPLLVSEKILQNKNFEGKSVIIDGQLRTHNNKTGRGSKLLIYVFVLDIKTNDDNLEEDNYLTLSGYICKDPVYRQTPLGREITDLMIAVNRNCGKSDYIPCICWGRFSKYAASLIVGDSVTVHGRIQSREFTKRVSEKETVTKIAYEVSISQID